MENMELNPKEMEKKELAAEELEKAEGGLVVYRGLMKNCWVVDDETGKKIGENFFKCDAQATAIKKGVSEKVISYNEYKKRFNK